MVPDREENEHGEATNQRLIRAAGGMAGVGVGVWRAPCETVGSPHGPKTVELGAGTPVRKPEERLSRGTEPVS